MIIEQQIENSVLSNGQEHESIDMSLDMESTQILMQMLSKNLYSDAIGSTIRETVSNALDSHRKLGVDTPIIVSFKVSEQNNYEFCVEDFGTGLDHDDVTNIISKYGKSTKRDSNLFIGAMGLGWKAPLAYSSSFYFVCRKEGIERKYIMYEGETNNVIDLLYETETTEVDGVKIIIPVKYSDKYTFFKKIKEQLCYFENVYFDVPEECNINNEFSILRQKDFQLSDMNTDNNMHICLDNVYYPIDYSKLDMYSLNIPIGLRFSLSDGIFPTPNREALRYTPESISIIKAKLIKVADYFANKYNKSIKGGLNVQSMIKMIETKEKSVDIGDGKQINISSLVIYSTIKLGVPKIKGINSLDINLIYNNYHKEMLDNAFSCEFVLDNVSIKNMHKHYVGGYTLKDIYIKSAIVYKYDEKISILKKDYLKNLYGPDKKVFFVKKCGLLPLKVRGNYYSQNRNNYYTLLSLRSHPKNKWREIIKDYQLLTNMIGDSFINLDDLEIPKEFIDSQKKVKLTRISTKRNKLQGEIYCERGVQLLRYNNGRNCKFESQIYKLKDLHKAKHLKVYTSHDDFMKLDALYGVIDTKQKVELITFSNRDIKIIDKLNIHNLISYEKFMEGNTAPFKRIITAFLIKDLISDYSYVFNREEQIKFSSETLSDKLVKLNNYKKDNYVHSDSTLKKAMLVVAEKYNLFDQNIYSEYKEMKIVLEKLSFLNPLCGMMGYYNKDNTKIKIMTDLFKYYKQKVNLDQYKIKINEEILTEQLLEELI